MEPIQRRHRIGAQRKLALRPRFNTPPVIARPCARAAKGPVNFTGCLSEVSACAAPSHAYCNALKDYAQVYAKYQAYLAPFDSAALHDYAPGTVATEQYEWLCLLGVDEPQLAAPVSDEDIDSFGYLGWLRH